ncbi:hypothetical protein FHX64_002545 [Microbacter margulisiae]|uniref:Uncharacterized protein n=1 Tax=Microbacter margulisiae TaxID=1350067 RepID=A0A7W5DSN3_9PORP|nr:hypothetical protein [Microbacter margulisiae]
MLQIAILEKTLQFINDRENVLKFLSFSNRCLLDHSLQISIVHCQLNRLFCYLIVTKLTG